MLEITQIPTGIWVILLITQIPQEFCQLLCYIHIVKYYAVIKDDYVFIAIGRYPGYI